MAEAAQRPRARRAAWLGAIAAALVIAIGLARIVLAPGVPATCTKVLDLAERAGERVGEGEREACERHYQGLREREGIWGWARMSWCIRRANSIPEAGQC